MAGVSSKVQSHHHNDMPSVLSRENLTIKTLAETIESFTNPFTEKSSDLFNLVTKVVMPDNIKNDLCDQPAVGKMLLESFVSERIKTGKINIWASMKKRKLSTWKTNAKKIKVVVKEQMVELRENRSLFARLFMVCKSRPEIDVKEVIGMYEFTVVPRSLFASDGSMLYTSNKSALMKILEKLQPTPVSQRTATEWVRPLKVAIVDGMADLQALAKPDWVKNCGQLAAHFIATIDQKYGMMNEQRLVFDRYDVAMTLKQSTREKRQGGQAPIYYRITDSTNITKVTMKKLLSHSKTKMELTTYLADKAIEHFSRQNGSRFIVAWASKCKATHKDVGNLQSNQEEADTKILLHAVDATSDGATEIQIHSPDTDVLVLALRRYPELCDNVSFVTGTGANRRTIQLGPIVEALGQTRSAALPAFHAISGADVTGSFSGYAKTLCWQAFMKIEEDVARQIARLGTTTALPEEVMEAVEKFVCKLYAPKTSLTSVKELRWWLFRKKQAQSEKLPPTMSALRQAVLRAHYQALVWSNDVVANPELPCPENYGWENKEDRWVPVMTLLQPAPNAVLELVRCGCKTHCSSNRCQCRRAGLQCTDLCACFDDDGDPCQNVNTVVVEDDDTGTEVRPFFKAYHLNSYKEQ